MILSPNFPNFSIPIILVVALISVVRIKFSLDQAIEFNLALLLFAIALIMLMIYSYFHARKNATSEQR